MSNLRDVLVYLCANYPHSTHLSKARLAKLVYLADWRSAITRGTQLTSIEWVYNHYGPYVSDIENLADNLNEFEVEHTTNVYGKEKDLIHLKPGIEPTGLDEEERAVLDYVIQTTASMYWSDFIRLVYSTYPMLTQERHSKLDLVTLAAAYKTDHQRFAWSESPGALVDEPLRA